MAAWVCYAALLPLPRELPGGPAAPGASPPPPSSAQQQQLRQHICGELESLSQSSVALLPPALLGMALEKVLRTLQAAHSAALCAPAATTPCMFAAQLYALADIPWLHPHAERLLADSGLLHSLTAAAAATATGEGEGGAARRRESLALCLCILAPPPLAARSGIGSVSGFHARANVAPNPRPPLLPWLLGAARLHALTPISSVSGVASGNGGSGSGSGSGSGGGGGGSAEQPSTESTESEVRGGGTGSAPPSPLLLVLELLHFAMLHLALLREGGGGGRGGGEGGGCQ